MINGSSKTKVSKIPVPRFYLIDARNKMQLSAEQVSRKLGLGKFYYYQLENGQRGIRMGAPLIYRLVTVLDLNAQEFLEHEIEHERMYKKINCKR